MFCQLDVGHWFPETGYQYVIQNERDTPTDATYYKTNSLVFDFQTTYGINSDKIHSILFYQVINNLPKIP